MDARDKIIEDLQKLVLKQSAEIAALRREIAELKLALAKATKDSSTSSKPPSSDITKPKTPKKPGRRGKPKRGGQPGHQEHLRENLPPERVDETFDYEMTDEDVQRLELTPTDEFETYQFIELPESPVFVTEHRLRVYLTNYGERYVPDVGDILNKPIFGPRLLAMIGWIWSWFAILLQQRRRTISLRASQSANTSWKAATKFSCTICLRTTSVLCLQTASNQPIITTNNKSGSV